MKRLHTWLLAAVALVSVFLLAGCLGPSKKEGSLTFGYTVDSVGDLNPHAYLPNQFITIDMVYEGLVMYGEGGRIVPVLATSWDISPDGKTYTFHLRKNVQFSDGSAFNGANVVKNFDAIFGDPKVRENHTWFGLTNYIESYESPEPDTFVLHLTHPYSATLYDLAMIRPIRFISDSSFPADGNTSDKLAKQVGTGPWMLSKHVANEYAVFVPNPHYWGTKPAASEILIKVIPDPETMALQFESGDLDLIYGNAPISLDRFNAYRNNPKYVTEVSRPMSTRMLMFNTTHPVTGNLLVRKALEHAVDKKAISEHIFGGVEEPAHRMFAPGTPQVDDIQMAPYEFNLVQAGMLLDEAGWRVQPDGRRMKNGQPLEIFFPYISSHFADKQIAEFIQSEWGKLGITVTLKALDETQYWEEARKGQFDVMMDFTWGAPWDPHAFLSAMTQDAKGGGPNYYAQQGLPMKQRLDETIHELLLEPDVARLHEEYTYVLTTLHDEAVYIPITYQALELVYRKGELQGAGFLPEENRLPVFTTSRVSK